MGQRDEGPDADRPLDTVSGRKLALACLTLHLALAACGGEEARRREAVVGKYSREKLDQAGSGGQSIRQLMTLTLRADNRWTMLSEATVNGVPYSSTQDSGSYSLKGATLVTNSPISGLGQFTVSGDTLRIDAAAYLVRER